MRIIQTTKEMRVRDPNDFYPTPIELCYRALKSIEWLQPKRILDPGAGAGPWGTAAKQIWPGAYVVGSELRESPCPPAYDEWHIGDFMNGVESVLGQTFDLVMGNPPYKYSEQFVRLGLATLRPGGRLLFLLPLQFLASKRRGRGLYRETCLLNVDVCVSRPSFTGNGKTDATDYGLFTWGRFSGDYNELGEPVNSVALDWLDWEGEKKSA
jgi:SAM-dependent methyltransferase